METNEKASAIFFEGDDGSSYNGGQRGYFSRQQFPPSLKAELPKAAQLVFPCAPRARCGHLPSLQLRTAASLPRHQRARADARGRAGRSHKDREVRLCSGGCRPHFPETLARLGPAQCPRIPSKLETASVWVCVWGAEQGVLRNPSQFSVWQLLQPRPL